ncbi:MAG: prepilin-type N-terminal cleavage/methylation domain-containing protein [Candidatus Pacebacteria bacterium]|nr:prepilin-type N-terminal cleavage/methylation domain-containing protein [Candidatus Paceibacterota bacterium]
MKGFTILELLLSVAMIAVLAAASVPLYSIYRSRGSVDSSSSIAVNSLRSAIIFSTSGKANSQWGVHFEKGKITIFKGDSFSSRDISYDKVVTLEDDVTFSGINDVYFNNKGLPSQTGLVTVSYGQDSRDISIGQSMIDY